MNNKFEFEKVIEALEKAKVDIPQKISNLGRNFFVQSFVKQGFTDEAFEPWEEVKRREPGTPEYMYPKKKDPGRRTRKILFGNARTGNRLWRGVGNCERSHSWEQIVWGIDVPYAEYHNEGDGKIPKRHFMGHSAELDRKIDKLLEIELKKVFEAA